MTLEKQSMKQNREKDTAGREEKDLPAVFAVDGFCIV